MLVKLPNGFFDGVDHFNHVLIDELKGKQQNYLANAQLVVNNIGHIPKILGDVVLSFQTKEGLPWKGEKSAGLDKLPSGDIETILIKLREHTFGPRFYHEATCSHCGQHHKELKLDLSTLELDVLAPEEMMKPKSVVLPKCGKTIVLRPQYLRDLFEAIKINNDRQDELITGALKLSIKSIDGKENITEKDVEELPVTDLYYLNDEAEKMKLEGTIDTTIEITCINCKKDFKVRLNPLKPDFFSRTGASISMNI